MEEITFGIDDMFAEDMRDPEFQKIYRQQKPYFDLVVALINRRRELKITQKELAKKIGTFQSRISKIESGEHNFRLSAIINIAEALGTEVVLSLKPISISVNTDYFELSEIFSNWANMDRTRRIDCSEENIYDSDTNTDTGTDSYHDLNSEPNHDIESKYVMV